MRIQNITFRNMNDFYALYVCEHCGSPIETYGYQDSNFHANVIPDMVCKECNKKRSGEVEVYLKEEIEDEK